ncbi:hypothetical protein ID866_3201, partial [Astraeus odoratus]
LPPRFGLIDDSLERWSKFKASIQQLNVDAPSDVQYKVFFLARHGEGYHNVAEAKYGTKNPQHQLTCPPADPELTPKGEGQADSARAIWKTELQFGLPFPDLYSSPLTRAIRTNQITFRGLFPDDRKTTIVENIREEMGIHTCDKRRTRTEIQQKFPRYLFEDGFTEEDELWKPDVRETWAGIDARARAVLDSLFNGNQHQFVSITTHGGFINAFLRVTKHRHWALPTGGMGHSCGCEGLTGELTLLA